MATVQAWQSITKKHVQCLQYELLASGNELLLNYSKATASHSVVQNSTLKNLRVWEEKKKHLSQLMH